MSGSNEKTPVVSPFATRIKRRRDTDEEQSDNKSSKTNRVGVVVCKNASTMLNGFAVFIDGYAERAMTHAHYNRNQDQSKTFMEAVDAVPHVFKLKEDEDDDKRLRKNTKGYDLKALVVLTGADAEQKDNVDFCEKTLLPSILNIDSVEINEKAIPHLDKNFEFVTSWNQILTAHDIKWLVNDFAKNCMEVQMSAATFLKKDVNHVAACFKPGTITDSIKQDYYLADKHLPAKDRKEAGKVQASL